MISAKSFNGYFVFFTWLLSVSWMFVGPNREVWHVQPTSHLRVDGQTNVNQFHCIVPDYNSLDSLVCLQAQVGTDACRVAGSMHIPIAVFDCQHRMMTKDLQKTLKMEQYPTMRIDFKNFSQMPSKLSRGSTLIANTEIRLAGVTKSYHLVFTVKNAAGHVLDLKGSLSILFSDFKLIPPSKLGGTIRVKDELIVNVSLQLRRQRG